MNKIKIDNYYKPESKTSRLDELDYTVIPNSDIKPLLDKLQQENRQLKVAIDKAMSILKDNFIYEYVRGYDTTDGTNCEEIDTEHFTYKAYEILKEVSE